MSIGPWLHPSEVGQDQRHPVNFEELMQLDITGLFDKKKRFSYLSWAWAVIEMRRRFPEARWWPHVFVKNGTEHLYDLAPDGSAIVGVYVRLSHHDVPHFMHLAVLDETNRAISEELIYREGEEEKVAKKPWTNNKRKPNAADIANSIMRCLAKAMATATGISLHLYAGEDIPPEPEVTQQEIEAFQAVVHQTFGNAKTVDELKTAARDLDPRARKLTQIGWFQAQFKSTMSALEGEARLDNGEEA